MEEIKRSIIRVLDEATDEQLRIIYLFAAHLLKCI